MPATVYWEQNNGTRMDWRGEGLFAMMSIFAAIKRLFFRGWHPDATRRPAHPGRLGARITPWSVVLHTTDMLPNTFGSLVQSWTTKAGAGQCAHFLIGRNSGDGLIQFAPIDRNANHAGGIPLHGWYVVNGKRVHPNSVSVGIEIHNAGQLRFVDGQWRSWDYASRRPQGAPIPMCDVEIDSRRMTRGWHRITTYQRDTLSALLTWLETEMAKMPDGVTVQANGAQTNQWAVAKSARIVGHVTLDPDRKTDPGPEVMRVFARPDMAR